MNKRTVHYLTEIFWLFLGALPIVAYLIMLRAGGALTYAEFITNNLGFLTPSTNAISTALEGAFGAEGVMPILSANVIGFLTYFIIIEIAHLCVDALLFIVRLAHSWLDGFVEKGGKA